jgi:cell division protein FtsQ
MAAVAAPADKRFRRAQVKPARQRQVSSRYVWIGVKLLIVLGLAAYGGWRGTALLLNAPALQVSRIVMRGNERLSSGEMLALVEGLRGENILTVNLAEWRERLLASAWVESAQLRRVLPARIEIAVRERRPMGLARLSGALYLVDDSGVLIDEYGPNYADLDLPIIDGLAAPPGAGAGMVDDTRTELAARLLNALASRPDLAARISQVDVSDAHDAVVILEGDTVMLRLGEEDFAARIQEYIDLAPALRERIAEIDYVDLRFDERLYVRPVAGKKR